MSKSQEICSLRFSIASMKFFVSLLSGLLCLVNGTLSAHAATEGLNVEVLGVYFAPSPNLASSIVRVIDESEHEVLVQAYGFTHNGIAQALVRAHQRGVIVRVLLDKKSQSSNRFVIDVLAGADIDVREDGKHAIAHNKVMVIDQSIVITGSFNFTNSAVTRNAENFLVLRSLDLAQKYRSQWQNHWAHGVE